LQRGPDAAGLGWWVPQATVGQGRQNVLNAFAASSAFRELAGTLYREAYWLVADHLGTPRMIFDKTNSRATTSGMTTCHLAKSYSPASADEQRGWATQATPSASSSLSKG